MRLVPSHGHLWNIETTAYFQLSGGIWCCMSKLTSKVKKDDVDSNVRVAITAIPFASWPCTISSNLCRKDIFRFIFWFQKIIFLIMNYLLHIDYFLRPHVRTSLNDFLWFVIIKIKSINHVQMWLNSTPVGAIFCSVWSPLATYLPQSKKKLWWG